MDEDDTAELAAVVLDEGELVRRREKKLKSLYKQIRDRGFEYYKCMGCGKRYERYLNPMMDHIIEEHMDKVREVDSEMRREVLARKKANHGVEDPVYWEEYYRTNCKLRRPV